jgi:hypothetical protein
MHYRWRAAARQLAVAELFISWRIDQGEPVLYMLKPNEELA